MSAARKPHGPGRQAVLRAFPDRAQRLHYALANNQADAVSVWRDAAIRLLDGRLMAPHNPGYLLGCLLLLDGVATDFDLRAAWGALADAWRDTAGSTGIEWHDADGRLQRRHLSVVTQLSWAQQRGAASYDAAAEALAGVLAEPAATDGQAGDGPLHHLIENVQAALVLMVSGDLAGHAIGRQPLTAVSRACLVRRDTQRALLPTTRPAAEDALFGDDADDPPSAVDPLDFGLHDAVLANADPGSLPPALIASIRAACTQDTEELPGSARQRASMLRRLRALAPACEAAGGWTAFLLLAVVTLVKVGTRETRPLAASSIWAYVPLLLDALAPRLGQFSISEAASIDWHAVVYEPALADPSVPAGQRGKLSAALTAFHDTLCGVLGAAPLEKRLSADTGGPVRCAELVWPHEVQRALVWLEAAPAEDRLLAQCHAVLAMLAAGAFRFEDPFHLHLAGVRQDGAALQLAIDPLPTAGEGKSPAARRTVCVTDLAAVGLLQAWLQRRQDEGAMPRDLLFGDPADGRRAYRRGATMCVLNALLKAATGEMTVGTHELRHAFLSLARLAMGEHDQRALDSASAAAGHEWTSTTLQRYCNLYERPLRTQLDARLRELVITERAACQLANLKPGILRQRWKRGRLAADECIWAALTTAARAVPFRGLVDEHPTGMPSNPLAPSSAPLRFGQVHAVLTDLVAGHPSHVVALRQGVTGDLVATMLLHLDEWRHMHEGRQAPVATGSAAMLPWAESWARARRPKWEMVRRALDKAPLGDLVPVVASWAATASAHCIAFTRPETGFDLLKWLAGTGLLADQLVLCHAQGWDPEPAAGLLRGLLGGDPVLRSLAPRRGRPKAYLLICSRVAEKPGDLANAALSVAGLHVLMFSAWVWTRMVGGQRDE